MAVGYDRPLYILPFDHRASFEKGLFGFTAPLTPEQTATVAASKQVVYDGLKAALGKGVPREAAGILVDEQFGAAILRDARAQGLITACPVEMSGQNEFQFEYGDRFADHIAEFKPTFVKALVRYNPEDDEALNRRQAARLKQLADYAHSNGHHFMFELLVPMTKDQSERLDGDQHLFDHALRPSLMIEAIRELQNAGVEPDVWKIEGLDRREDCAAVAVAARRDGRDKVGCILLGRGSNEAGIVAWLRAAAPLPAFIGFAVGRTSFWDALAGLRDKKVTRERAVEQIADNYLKWVRTFEEARKAG
jgi:myo-inositol catabolism protein IolC